MYGVFTYNLMVVCETIFRASQRHQRNMISKSMFNPLFSPMTALTTELLKQSDLFGCHSFCRGSVHAKNMSEPGLDVADCVKRARQKDEEAARQWVEHLYPLVFKLVGAYLPRRASEEDLA